MSTIYSVERDGGNWVIYLGGLNLGRLSESDSDVADQIEQALNALHAQSAARPNATLLDASWPVAEIVECRVMGQQTVAEIEGRWKFLQYGDKLYTATDQLLAEVAAWRARFPQYRYRPQDDIVALK